MDKSQIRLDDIHRILFGNAPATFMIETFFRTVFIYICLLLIIKWLGKRMAGQMTVLELGIVIMLGAIVSPPMESPDRGVIQGVLILLLALLYHQWITLASIKYRKIESIVKGKMTICVRDGIIDTRQLDKMSVSHTQLFEVLRGKHIYQAFPYFLPTIHPYRRSIDTRMKK